MLALMGMPTFNTSSTVISFIDFFLICVRLLNLFENVSLKKFNESSHTIIGTFQKGESIYHVDTKTLIPWILVIGNEAHGITTNNIDNINLKVTIPKIGSGDSLNAAVAGSVLLYHLTASL